MGRSFVVLASVAALTVGPSAYAEPPVGDQAPSALLTGSQTEILLTPGTSPWVVPCGVSDVEVGAWGAEGGDGNDFGFGFENGGGLGGHSETSIAVTAGETLTVVVGGAGADAAANAGGAGGAGGGGDGADNPGGSGFAGGGGGGASQVRRGATPLVGAGGGGGGGGGFAGDSGTFDDHKGGTGGGTGTNGAGGLDSGGKAGGTGGAGGTDGGPPGAPGAAAAGPQGGSGGEGTGGIGGGGGGGGGVTTGGGGGASRLSLNGAGGGGGDGLAPNGTTTDGVSAANNGNGKITLTYNVGDCRPSITITTPAEGGVYAQGSTVLADYACADAGGGVTSCTGDVADGQPIDTSTTGPHTFSVTAADDDGNERTVSNDYTVVASGMGGTVIDSSSGDPVPGAWLAVLHASDLSIAGSAVADGSGNFSVELPAGSYLVYVIDPTGDHVAGFHGPPTTVVVPVSSLVDVDPAVAPTRGSVVGTVTEEPTADPVPGAWAITLSGTTAAPETGATADATGAFVVPRVTPGEHFVAVVDPTGARRPEFWPDSPNALGASRLAVSAGGAANADLALSTQTPSPGGHTVSGTVTESGTGEPLAGVYVIALRAADYGLARGAVTSSAGAYSLDLDDGAYLLEFVDSTGRHDMEWHQDHPYFDIALADPVTAPTTVDADLAPRTGTLTGTVTSDPAGTPLEGVWVIAIGPGGVAGGALTGTDGTYTIDGLAPGTYRATFADPVGGRTQEYWDDASDYSGATAIPIAAGTAVAADAALAGP